MEFLTISIGVHVVSYVAVIIIVLCFIPQAIMVLITKNTKATSLWTFLVYEAANLLWVIWSLVDWISNPSNINSDLTMLIPNLLVFIIVAVIVAIKIHNMVHHGEDRKNKEPNINQIPIDMTENPETKNN